MLAGTGLLVASPSVIGALPASSSAVPASTLLARINSSGSVSYSGYAESVGSESLPVTGEFSDVADLLGGTTDLRVWWRSGTDWRVDDIAAGGETDVHTSAAGSWTWNYERNTAIFVKAFADPVRLPESQDLPPPELARRLLSQALPTEVSRLPSARIAGRSVPGLRLIPAQPESTISHVDVWAEPGSGLALRVRIYAKGQSLPVLTSTLLDLSTARPSESTIAFHPPAHADTSTGDGLDIASAVNRFSTVRPVSSLAGLPRNTGVAQLGAVGVYGRGVTELVAIPVPQRFARSLQHQLSSQAGVAETAGGYFAAIGPLNLFVSSNSVDDGTVWVLAGSVSQPTMTAAAQQLTGTG